MKRALSIRRAVATGPAVGIGLAVFSGISWTVIFTAPDLVLAFAQATPGKLLLIYAAQAFLLAAAVGILRLVIVPTWRRAMLLAMRTCAFLALSSFGLNISVGYLKAKGMILREVMVEGASENVVIVSIFGLVFSCVIYALLSNLEPYLEGLLRNPRVTS